MRKAGDVILSGLLGCFVGSTYFLIEVAWKTAQGHPEGISWTMLVLALGLGILMERMGAELPWRCPIWTQALLCGLAITAAEFTAGCILNLWLGWGVWDYSDLPGNVLGQIYPQFAVLWCFVSGPVIIFTGLDAVRRQRWGETAILPIRGPTFDYSNVFGNRRLDFGSGVGREWAGGAAVYSTTTAYGKNH